MFMAPITEMEIKTEVQLGGYQTSGRDGFNGMFYQNH
jgi:hypothetical protein